MSEYVPGPILNLAPPRMKDRTRGGGGNGGGKPPKLTAKQVVKKLTREQLRDAVWARLSDLADDLEQDATLTREEVGTLLFSVGASVVAHPPSGSGWDVGRARSLANAVFTAFEVSGVPPSAVGRRK